MTAGPWRPVHLHSYTTSIKYLRVSSAVNADLAVELDVSISFDAPFAGSADIVLLDSSGNDVSKKNDVGLGDGDIKEHFHLAKGDVELWYPVGYGKQPLYSVKVEVKDEVCTLSKPHDRVQANFQSLFLARTSGGGPNAEGRVPSCAGCARTTCRSGRPHVPLRNQ